MTLAESLKKIRKQYKLTQEDVAKLVGVSRSGYTYYETGTTVPSLEVLKKLSAIYRVSIDDIVCNSVIGVVGADCSAAAEGKADPLMFMEKDEKSLIMMYRLLDDQGKEQLRKAVEEILDIKDSETTNA